jgi:peptidyl-prolyl cis-trans isomerase B (cyclophilin B)
LPGLCPERLRQNRGIGDKSALCEEPQPLGRIVIGLYGNLVPITVSNFLRMVKAGAYTGTTFSKVFPGVSVSRDLPFY